MPYGERFDEALLLASELHRKQTRKGSGVPYITHLLAVASLVGENGGTENEVVAALLHDAIEDTDETRDSLAARFGDEVAGVVAACSDADVAPGEEKPPWRERKESYIARVGAPSAPEAVRLVSSADKLHNVRAMISDYRAVGEDLWDRFKGGREGTFWYYRALVEAFERSDDGEDKRPSPIVEELVRAVAALHDLAGERYPR